MSEELKIGVKAVADFGDVEREGRRASERLREGFERINSAGPRSALERLFGGDRAAQSAERDLSSLQQALERTGQAGKRLGDIKLDPSQFREAASQLLNVQRNLDHVYRTHYGRDIRRRLAMSGQDPKAPFSWDWSRMGYRSSEDAARAQHEFHARAGGGGGGPSVAVLRAQRAGEFVGTGLARSAGAAASLAGVGSALGLVVAGYREHMRTVEGVDRAYKGLGDGTDFERVRDAARVMGEQLLLSAADAADAGSLYVRGAAAVDRGAFERAELAGNVGRSYGLEPRAGIEEFARAELLGRGNQREFAALLAQTLERSGMQGRADQVLRDLVGKIEEIASREGRTATDSEVGQYGAFLGAAYAEPALRGGGAQAMLQALGRLGSGDGAMQRDFAWRAFGESVGMDYVKLDLMREADLFASPRSLGIGEDETTKLEMVYRRAREMGGFAGGSDADSELKTAWMMQQVGGVPMGLGKEFVGLMQRLGDGNISGFSDWVKGATGGSLTDVEPGAFRHLAMLYEDRGGGISERELALARELVGSGEVSGPDRRALSTAIDSGDTRGLEELLPRVVAGLPRLGTDAERAREADAAMMRALEPLGGGVAEVVMGIKNAVGAIDDLEFSAKGAAEALRGIPGAAADGFKSAVDSAVRATIPAAEASSLPVPSARPTPITPQSVVSPAKEMLEAAERGGAPLPKEAKASPAPVPVPAKDEGVLKGVDPRLKRLLAEFRERYPELPFKVTEGVRSMERQRKLFAEGKSKTLNSRHLTGDAVDVAPLDERGRPTYDWSYYHPFADRMKALAKELDIPVTWGGDWKSFKDGPHWQVPVDDTPHEAPEIPPDYDQAVSAVTHPNPYDARWQGQVQMELLLRNDRGELIEKRNSLAVSEPRIAGSGGPSPESSRFRWADTVVLPG